MRDTYIGRWGLAIGAVLLLAGMTGEAAAQDYYYEPRSFYVAPPLYSWCYPVLGRAPIVVYEPAPPVAPPVVGYYEIIPSPAVRIRERGYSSPYRARYRYTVEYPDGLEYKFRYKRDGGYIRYYDRWGY